MTRLCIGPGCPIRKSPAELARQLTEAYRSRAASFFGLQRLGIHRAPLVASPPLHYRHNFCPDVNRDALWDPSGHFSIRLLTCRPFATTFALAKNRPDAGRFARVHQRKAELGVAICHCQTSVYSAPRLVSRLTAHEGVGGAEGARTPDPLLAKEVLSQLSYGPTELVGDGGLEPPTSVLSGPRSNQLS